MKELISRPQSKKERWAVRRAHIALALHTIILEGFVYSVGSCMNSALIGMQSAAYLSHKGTLFVDLRALPGAPSCILYALHRTKSDRKDYPVTLSVSDWRDRRKSEALTLGMNQECMVYALETN